MNFLFIISATVALIFVPLAFYLFFTMERYRKKTRNLELQIATNTGNLELLKKEAEEVKNLRAQNSSYLEQKSIAITQHQESENKLLQSEQEKVLYLRQKDEAIKEMLISQKQLELIQQKMLENEKRMQDWELQRQESIKAAKASILEAGGQLSSKLLEDHKRETLASKKEAEESVKKTSEELLDKMLNVTKSVAALKEQTGETTNKLGTVWRALASPAGAGYLAEIGLENSLKNLGLEPQRDYIMQYAINSDGAGNLRPDAVIFLPQDMVMVIDSKSSKFLLEIADDENGSSEPEKLASLKNTMNIHLKSLISKDYKAAIKSLYAESGRGDKIGNILNVMYVPSENAINHIKRADPEFVHKTEKAEIILAGPASLSGLLSLARLNIGMVRQAENQEKILATVEELMDNIITALSYSDKVGRAIKRASDDFNNFAGSVNTRMLPKMRKLLSFGVTPKKSRELPAKITSYDVRPSDEIITIENEVEEESA